MVNPLDRAGDEKALTLCAPLVLDGISLLRTCFVPFDVLMDYRRFRRPLPLGDRHSSLYDSCLGVWKIKEGSKSVKVGISKIKK